MPTPSHTLRQKKAASTKLALSLSELEAAQHLLGHKLPREALVHLYFSSFYAAQALLIRHLKSNPSHKHVEAELHKHYGRSRVLPRRYVALHTELHRLRNEFDYHKDHSPSPHVLARHLKSLGAFVHKVLSLVPRVDILDLMAGFVADHPEEVKDLSLDIYCPKTYRHHTRMTVWQPTFYLSIFTHRALTQHARKLLRSLRVRNHQNYVVGMNSRLNQYAPVHLIMLDLDTLDPSVETALAPFGGVLLKSGRGFHFLGNSLLPSQEAWVKAMKGFLRNKALKPFLDRKHILISLQRGYSTLRITESPIKPHVPFFYKAL